MEHFFIYFIILNNLQIVTRTSLFQEWEKCCFMNLIQILHFCVNALFYFELCFEMIIKRRSGKRENSTESQLTR